jgi:hypothetical protein
MFKIIIKTAHCSGLKIIEQAMNAMNTRVSTSYFAIRRYAEKMLFCTANEVIGGTVDRFIPDCFNADHGQHISTLERTGGTSRKLDESDTITGLGGNGEEFPIGSSIFQAGMDSEKSLTNILSNARERHDFIKRTA